MTHAALQGQCVNLSGTDILEVVFIFGTHTEALSHLKLIMHQVLDKEMYSQNMEKYPAPLPYLMSFI